MLEETCCAPSAAEHDERLLVLVEWELWARMAFLVRDVVECAGSYGG